MDVLIKQAKIVNPDSPHHGKVKDILIEKGIITQIEDRINKADTHTIESDNLHISTGWVDGFGYLGEPGEEHKENLETGMSAAANGGFTDILSIPNTVPTCTDSTQIQYLKTKSKSHITNLHPMGTITVSAEGKSLAEMMDMAHHGAVAFTDGIHPIQDDGLMMRALEYSKSIDTSIVQLPISKDIQKQGQMHEGDFSVKYGLTGIPYLAETILLLRDIEMVKYTDTSLHIAGISSAKSVDIIRKAKKDKVNITCSVSPFHLIYTDEDLGTYDTNLKLHLPLRTEKDRKALIKAVNDGDIDTISSHHFPVNPEAKQTEFSYAEEGMISFQTVLPLLIKAGIQIEKLDTLLSQNPRAIYNLTEQKIAIGNEASLTLFDPSFVWDYNPKNNYSTSKNSNLLGTKLTGKIIAIINNNKKLISK